MTDEQIMVSLDDVGLAILIDRYQRLVFSIARNIVKDDGEAEDVVQTVFLEIWRKQGLFNPTKGTFKVWLMRYAYTRATDRYRELTSRNFYTQSSLAMEGLPRWDAGDTAILIRECLPRLEAKQRRAVHLIGIEGLTISEASIVMRYTLAAVRNYYFRGLKQLRMILGVSGGS